MTLEEELLYYLTRASMLIESNKQEIDDPNYEKNMKANKEYMELLKKVIEAKKKGESTYDYVDYDSEKMKYLIQLMKELANDLEDVGEGLN